MPKHGFKRSEEAKRRISETMKKRAAEGLLLQVFKKGCPPPAHAFKKGHGPWIKGKTMKGRVKTGEKSHMWKGGIRIFQGYVYIYSPDHPRAWNETVKRANLVMEKHLGRYLEGDELVHHKNRDRQDDRLENLQLCKNRSEHLKIHRNESRGNRVS